MKKIESLQFESLFLEGVPLIDVRAPVEFRAGAAPGSVNLPLLDDEERRAIGTAYKRQGQAAAIELGHRLIQGSVREARIEAWLKALEREPRSAIYCFRGGLRSQIAQRWVHERGGRVPLIDGGYKALRRFLLSVFTERLPGMRFEVVRGPTGAGKTDFLKSSGRPYLDLEELAGHRGSAFGALDERQPSQADFENAMAVKLLHLSGVSERILIEDESRMIGQCVVPGAIFEKIKAGPFLDLQTPLEERVENIFRAYVLASSLGVRGDLAKFDDFRRSVMAISQRLGGAHTQEILNDLDAAQREFQAARDLESNRVWIRKLLLWYYDPRYSHSG